MFHAKPTNQSIAECIELELFLLYSPAPIVGFGLNVNWYRDVVNGVSIARGEELRLGHRSTTTVYVGVCINNSSTHPGHRTLLGNHERRTESL